MSQTEEQKKPTVFDILNAEWANDMANAKTRIAALIEENMKQKEVIEKQKAVIDAQGKVAKISK